MRIVVGTTTFGSEDRTPIDALVAAGVEVINNPVGRRWTEDEAIQFLQGADGLLAGLEPLTRRVLESTGGRLKAIARVGIGMDNVDIDAARGLGIKVSNTPDGPTEAVAEMTLGVLISLARDVEPINRLLHCGQWPKSIGRSLGELTVLVIGFGRIGRAVAAKLAAQGCGILVCDPYLAAGAEVPFTRVELKAGLAAADVVTLHASGSVPLIGEPEFAAMKPGVILLNSARGGLVEEAALVRALESGHVGKGWFDVFWQEPYSGPLLRFPQMLLTSHMCTYTRRCRLGMETEAVRNLLRDLELAP